MSGRDLSKSSYQNKVLLYFNYKFFLLTNYVYIRRANVAKRSVRNSLKIPEGYGVKYEISRFVHRQVLGYFSKVGSRRCK